MTNTTLSFAMRLSRTYQKPLDRTRGTSSKIRTRSNQSIAAGHGAAQAHEPAQHGFDPLV
jgi:hypothetical protein